MRALVWRYVSTMHRRMDDEPVTEDDIKELKGDVSAMRYELLEVFEKNGMDVSFTDRKEKAVLGKRMKVWERRLMKDFHVAPVTTDEEDKGAEDGLSKFRWIAKLAVANTSSAKWDLTLAATGVATQIGRCRSRESFKNQQNLQRAMDEARKLVMRSPIPEGSRVPSPIQVTAGHTLLELIKDISTEVGEPVDITKSPFKLSGATTPVPGTSGLGAVTPTPGRSGLLGPVGASRSVSPIPGAPSPGSVKCSPKPSAKPSPMPTPKPSPMPTPKPSPMPRRAVSPVGEAGLPGPSPLRTTKKPGESPPKAIKRKSPAPPTQSADDLVESASHEPKEVKDLRQGEDVAVARPIALGIKPVDGALPPPPPPPPVKPKVESASHEPKEVKDLRQGEDVAVARPIALGIKPVDGALPPPPPPPPVKPKTPAPTMEVTTSTPSHSPAPHALSPPPPASRPPSPSSVKSEIKPPTPLKDRPPSLTSRTSSSPHSPQRLTSTSSTEQLIPPPSPEPLLPTKKLEEIKSVKRQPKTGWL